MDVIIDRLWNQRLAGRQFDTPAEAVEWLGAVQAQDYAMVKWSLGVRVKGATDNTVEDALDKGEILRTHIMRPTWHCVLPQDIRWMQALTAPRVRVFMGPYNHRLGLDGTLFAKSNAIIAKALQGNNYRTRLELKQELAKAGIQADGQRLGHIIMWAELDALICNGPRRGKQFTYALVDERAPKAKTPSRQESLARLAQAYFSSHGPAQLVDFAWWSGLGLRLAAEALELIKPKLQLGKVGEKVYWFSPSQGRRAAQPGPQAYLLSIFDEYTIAYKDRTDISSARDIERMVGMGNAMLAVMLVDGRVAGSWKRTIKKGHIQISLNPFRKLAAAEHEALKQAAGCYGEFMQMPVTIT